jgi:hypothetical protein
VLLLWHCFEGAETQFLGRADTIFVAINVDKHPMAKVEEKAHKSASGRKRKRGGKGDQSAAIGIMG